jgi:hypothetical protein
MKTILAAISILLLSINCFTQFTVTGRIIDSSSKEPLRGASVFCQNTTLGTATNAQGEFTLQLKSGGYDLIISFSGYQTITKRITGEENKLEIGMAREEKNLAEVVIQTSNEVKDGWDKYGKFFIENFIGTTPNSANCKIENPEVLKFYYLKKTNRLRVLAAEPVLITNKSLGYNLRYQLDTFVYYYKTDITSYRGFCLFSEMEGGDDEKKKWGANRKKAYFGSLLHFLRSYYDSTLKEDGYMIDMLDETNETKFNKVTDPYDTLYYGAADSTQEVDIWYPRKISITYTKKKPEPEYLKKFGLPKIVGTQISYIDLTEIITIQQNGYHYDQRDWVNQGYWSWKNLGDLLPYDFEP